MKTDGSKLKLHTLLSVLTLVIGVALMARQMYADDEPGAIPLLVVVIGIAWFLIARARLRSSAEAGRNL